MIPFLIIAAILIVLLEGIPLLRRKKWAELITASILISISLLIALGKVWGMATPIELVERLLYPVGKIIFKQF